jgi:Esterase FrsA-like
VKFYYDNPDYDDQLKRTALAAYCGAADLGEMLVAASAVKLGDAGSWYKEWAALAERAEALAKGSTGYRESAADAWLRAAEYWRQAFFFVRTDFNDERLQRGWSRHRAAFREALALLPFPSSIAEIPFGAGSLTGYLMRPIGPIVPRPTVILPAGYDSTAESGYVETAWMALARGMNAFTLEGPGQGGTLYRDHIPMRPDYEAVLTPAVDWLLGQEGVDPSKIVLIGRSLAGYLAPRGAAHEDRLAALVCDPGQFEFVTRIKRMLVPKVASDGESAWDKVAAANPQVDEMLQQLLNESSMREMLEPRMLTLGAKTVGEFIRKQAAFTLEAEAGLIRCPTLVVDCEGDFASQSDTLYAALTCEKKFLRLNAQSGAGGHCGGLGQQVWAGAVFPWIAGTLVL